MIGSWILFRTSLLRSISLVLSTTGDDDDGMWPLYPSIGSAKPLSAGRRV